MIQIELTELDLFYIIESLTYHILDLPNDDPLLIILWELEKKLTMSMLK